MGKRKDHVLELVLLKDGGAKLGGTLVGLVLQVKMLQVRRIRLHFALRKIKLIIF
jgi:hypothetical protein